MKTILKNSLYLILFSLFTHSCNEGGSNGHDHEHTKVEEAVGEKADQVSEKILHKGFEILESNCISCHSAKGTFEDRVAPPLSAIKNSYLKGNVTKEEFIASFVSFVENPVTENSKMPEAVEKFNLMPKMGYSKEQLTAVAEYIYNHEVEKADWYQKHFQHEKVKYAHSSMSDIERGQQIALQAKAVLGKNLMGAIKKDGTDAAVSFCNLKAFPLIDSMATELSAKIKRVTDKPRNANNTPNEQELAFINNSIAKLANGEKLSGEIHKSENNNVAYYPITTNDMCLKCHGTPKEEIKESTMDILSKLYPEDKATGYKANELRGIWVVEFE